MQQFCVVICRCYFCILWYIVVAFVTCAFVFLTSCYPCYGDAIILLLLLSSSSWANMFTLSSNTYTNATIEWCNNFVLLLLHFVISSCYFCKCLLYLQRFHGCLSFIADTLSLCIQVVLPRFPGEYMELFFSVPWQLSIEHS